MKKHMNIRLAVGTLAAAGVLAMTACGGAASSDGNNEAEAATITIAVPPNVHSLGVRAALEEGIFDEAGLDVELVNIQSGSEAAALLAGGNAQFAILGVHNAIMAQAEGHSTPITAPLSTQMLESSGEAHGFGTLIVAADGGINTAKDLEGKKIGTSVLGGEAYLNVHQKLEQEGVDADSIEWIQVPSPQHVSAVKQGQVDAAITPEPTVSIGLLDGSIKALLNPDDIMPGSPAFAYSSDAEWAEQNPEVVEEVSSAIIEANKLLNSDREVAERTIASFMDLDDEVISMVKLPRFAEEAFTVESLEPIAERLVEFDLLSEDKMPDLSEVLYSAK